MRTGGSDENPQAAVKVALSYTAGTGRMRLSCQEQLLPGTNLEALSSQFATSAPATPGSSSGPAVNGEFARRLPELRAAARAGIVMPTVCPDTDHFIGDFSTERRHDAVSQLRAQLSVIAELGGEGVLTPASLGHVQPAAPALDPAARPAEDRAVLMEALADLAEHAAREGVWLLLEPLNRYEDYLINRLEQAVELGEAIERELAVDSIRVCADLFHMNIEEDDLAWCYPCHRATTRARARRRLQSVPTGNWTPGLRRCAGGRCAPSTTGAGWRWSAGCAASPKKRCRPRSRSSPSTWTAAKPMTAHDGH